MMATVKVVKKLCEPFYGIHFTVYVDRLYIPIELLRELYNIILYFRGTYRKNLSPKEL